jgi:hypothetical protein
MCFSFVYDRRKFGVKFPTIWTDGKAHVRAVREEKESEEKKSEGQSQ